MSEQKKRRRGRKFLIVLGVILGLLLAAGAAVYAAFAQKYYGKSNYVSDKKEAKVYETLEPETEINEKGGIEYITEQTLDSEAAVAVQKVFANGLQSVKGQTAVNTEGVYNLLIIGVDRRDDSWYGNSDVTALLTLNHNKKKIYMTVFQKDLAADIPGIGVRKLSAACAHGGARLLVETLEENYGISVDNYLMIDFNALLHMVDLVGGIDINVAEDEVTAVNGYIRAVCEANQEPYEAHMLTGSGWMHLDGYQAVGYFRNRNSEGDSTSGMTVRQERVLNAVMNEINIEDLGDISSLIQEFLPYVTHNITQIKLLSLIKDLPSMMDYDMEDQMIPYDGMYHTEGGILVPDMEATLQKLYGTIYSGVQ